MPLPKAMTRIELQQIEDRLSTMYDDLAAICTELDQRGEYGLNARAKQAAGKLWSVRHGVQVARRERAA